VAQTIWRRSDDWVGREIEDSYIMVSITTGKYVCLNRTADAVWRALETPRTALEVCEILQAQFDVPAPDCAKGVAAALDTMRGMELAKAG
jgi:hypothetical protein